jgi:hypothetical protein
VEVSASLDVAAKRKTSASAGNRTLAAQYVALDFKVPGHWVTLETVINVSESETVLLSLHHLKETI